MHYSIFIHGTKLVTIQLLTVEPPVVVAFCNIEGHLVPIYLDRSGIAVTNIQKWDTTTLNSGIPVRY